MTTSRLLPMAMQAGLVFCHWWWVFALTRHTMLITPGSQYAGFAAVGNDSYWEWRAIPVAIISLFALLPIPVAVRETIVGIQAGWLVMLTVLYLQVRPFTTGPGAYIPLAWFALILMWVSWRGVDVRRQGSD